MTGRLARVPLVATIGAALIALVGLAVMVVGGQATGVSWDEPYRIGKLNNLFATGWFADDVKDGVPLDFNTFVYAPVADLISHAFGVLAGAQEWAHAAVTADAYAARHLAVGVFALVAAAAAAAVAGYVLGSWRWAVVTAGLLGAVPLWTGHGMFNTSDVPVAAGYTLVTLGVVVLVRAQASGLRWPALVGGGASLLAGMTLAIGTRPATWPAMVVSLVIALTAALLLSPAGGRVRCLGLTAASVGLAVVGAALLLWVSYPAGFGEPLRLLRESVTQSAKFGGQTAQPAEPTSLLEAAGYIPSWLAVQLPLVIALLSIAGLVAGAGVLFLVLARRWREPSEQWRAAAIVAIAAQLLVLPAGAAIMRSNVYDGVRQFLFILPVLAVVATIGVAAIVTLIGRAPRGSVVLQAVVWVLVGIGVLLPVVDQVRLFPYGYAYVNELAAREDINGRLPTDYWRTSMRELIPLVPAEGDTSCTFDPLILGLVPIDCATQGQLAPYWDTRGSQSLGVSVPAGKYLFLETNRGRVDPGPGCSVIDTVTRPLHGQDVVMSYVAVCEAPCVVQEAAQCAGKSLAGAVLDGWNLRGSDFTGADLRGTSLVLADLSGANLAGADLTGAILDSANLSGADLTGADFTGANLTNVNLDGAQTIGAVGLPPGSGG